MKAKHFKVKELVSEIVYNKYGEGAWAFLDIRLIETLDQLREFFGKPMYVNNWYNGGGNSQRGLRCNMDPLVKNKNRPYLSQHCLGTAVDFNVKGMTSKEVCKAILDNQDKFPHIKRMEHWDNTPSWTHIDLANIDTKEIYVFRP